MKIKCRKIWKVGDRARTRFMLKGRKRRGYISQINGAYITLDVKGYEPYGLQVYPNEIERFR